MTAKLEIRVGKLEREFSGLIERLDERETHKEKREKSNDRKFALLFKGLEEMPDKLLATMEAKAQQEDGKIVNRVLVWAVGILIIAVAYLITQGAPWAEAHAETVTLEGTNYVFPRK